MDKNELPGIITGTVGNAIVYADNVILHAVRGHGFAAEKANHLKDVLTGKDAHIVGGNNLKNGADRLVNGIQIQTKYCNSGSKSIGECFDNGRFRYWNHDGSPMQIEVPADQYNAAVQSMESRIKNGQVTGVTDPAQAKDIVRKGTFTYHQAKNIAKFGTIESITYDVANGIQVAGTAMGISAAITFAYAKWNGQDSEDALKQACYSGFKVGGITWISSILVAQLGRTGIEQTLRGTTDLLVKSMGPKAAAVIANGLRAGSRQIYGAAAMNNVSKLLRGNIVTGTITTLVLSSFDVANLVNGRISEMQLLKNVTTTASGVAGGALGYTIGAGIGTFFLPGFGTVAGGLIGGFLAGSGASSASKAVLDNFIEDDAVAMLKILNKEVSSLAFDYLLSEIEINSVCNSLQSNDFECNLKDMFAASNREEFAKDWVDNLIKAEVKKREKIFLPSDSTILECCGKIIEKLVEDPNELQVSF
jgi:hypothetical protein